MIKHIVTSGCSFSHNYLISKKWPHWLTHFTNSTLYNRATPGVGNGWICRSAMYETEKLLKQNIDNNSILVVVMWSGFERKGVYVSHNSHSTIVDILSRLGRVKNFILSPINTGQAGNFNEGYCDDTITTVPDWYNFDIDFKKFSENLNTLGGIEQTLIQNYEYFIQLQNYCKSKNIKLINLTYADIFHYPCNPFKGPINSVKKCYEVYNCIEWYHSMVDFDNWHFHKELQGQYEWTKDNNYSFDSDNSHPSEDSNYKYVIEKLIPFCLEKGILFDKNYLKYLI